MPNWCENEWDFFHDDPQVINDVMKLMTHVVTEKKIDDTSERVRQVTFNKIIPMPDCLRRTVSPRDEITIATLNADGSNAERPATDEERAEIRATGYDNWYDWSVANWGTKWGACEPFEVHLFTATHLKLCFLTAWSPPTQVVIALRKRFDSLDISAFYKDPATRQAGWI